MADLDLEFVRAQFPAFHEPGLVNRPFFENAGGSYVCQQVQDRLFRFYRSQKMQPGNPYSPSSDGAAEMEHSRRQLAAIMNVASDEVSFGPSTSQNTYVLSMALGEWLRPGDAIIVTNQDHEANTGVWRRLANRGFEVREWKIDPETGLLDVENLKDLLDSRVKFLAFPHCSNVIGAINPVKEITQIAQDAGAYVCIDGVSFAPHGIPDIGDIGADIYLFSAYKTYGPHQGIMVVRRGLGMELPNQGHYFNQSQLTARFTPAGPDHAQVAACGGIVDYFDAVHAAHFPQNVKSRTRTKAGKDLVRKKEIELSQPLLEFLDSKNSLHLIGPSLPQERAPTIAVAANKNARGLAEKLAEMGIMAGGDNFYAVRTLEALGIDPEHGVLRMSFLHYTSPDEIQQLIKALDQVA